jgi:hypothetical protein
MCQAQEAAANMAVAGLLLRSSILHISRKNMILTELKKQGFYKQPHLFSWEHTASYPCAASATLSS